ncbi:MAG: tetratricopeptide repeat protein [Nitrospira sp.]|nr:tetratricopeptide repeat protein [Nitrospira sp.]
MSPTFVQAFTKHTGGYPGHMALLFAQCMQQDLFPCGVTKHNLFDETDAGSEDELGAIFIHGGLYAPISKLRKTIYDTMEDDRGQVFDSFMRLVAACCNHIPFDWIVDCLALSSEDADWLEDRLTDELKECFTYRGVELKAFPNCEIYQPTNPWLSATITQALGKDLVQQAARKFSLYLSAHDRPRSEEVAKLFANIFLAAGDEDESAKMNQLLDCWIGYRNASALKERLIAQLGEQRLQPDRLWSIIKATDGLWPSWRRLVLLEAYGELPGGMPDDHRVPWQSDVGICLLDSGRYEDARQVFQDLLNSYTATSNDEYLVKASFLSCLGSIEIYLDQAHLALPYLKEAETIQRTALPPLHPALAPTLNSLGDCLRELGRPQEALKKLEEAETIQRTALPHLHHTLALTLNNLGLCLHAQGRLQEALGKFEEAETIRRTTLPPLHPDLAVTLRGLGNCLHELGHPREALGKLEEAETIQRTTLPPLHPDLGATLNNLGGCLLNQGRLQEALGKLEEAEIIQRTALPPLHPDLGTTLNNLGGCLRQLARPQEALAKWEEARTIFQSHGSRFEGHIQRLTQAIDQIKSNS